jgi:hypothetical protein
MIALRDAWDLMLADFEPWQLPVALLEWLILFVAIGCCIYFFVQWTKKK